MRPILCVLFFVSLACGPGPSTTDAGQTLADAGQTLAPCGLSSNPEPNDTRDTASTVPLNADSTFCLGVGDVDFVSFTTPAGDLGGGAVQLQFTQVATTLKIDVDVTAASDNGPVTSDYTTTNGANLTVWFIAKPNTTFRASIKNFAGDVSSASRYNLNIVYTAVSDTFEPNDTRDAAKPLTLGAAANAFFAGGYSAGSSPGTAYDDWYSVSLVAGRAVRVQLANVATTWKPYVEVYAPDNSEFDSKYVTTEGQSIDQTSPDLVTAAGLYKVRVYSFAGYPSADGKGPLADHLTRPYSITVSQP
jgi:hypothetical protein